MLVINMLRTIISVICIGSGSCGGSGGGGGGGGCDSFRHYLIPIVMTITAVFVAVGAVAVALTIVTVIAAAAAAAAAIVAAPFCCCAACFLPLALGSPSCDCCHSYLRVSENIWYPIQGVIVTRILLFRVLH